MKSFILIVFCVAFVPCLVLADDIYTWKDAKGVIHVTTQPPSGIKEKVTKHSYGSEAVLPPALPPAVPAEKKDLLKDDNKAVAEPTQKPVDREADRAEREKEIEKARQEYEEAKSHEEEYKRKYRRAYGEGANKRQYFRDKMEDIEKKRQKLEELERAQ